MEQWIGQKSEQWTPRGSHGARSQAGWASTRERSSAWPGPASRRYQRTPGSILDPLEPVIARLIEDWPEIKSPRVTEILRDEHGYAGSIDLVRKRISKLRPPSERPAQKTGYRPALGNAGRLGRGADPA